MTATGGTKTLNLDYSIDVFPMMQRDMGFWWSVSDAQGHILKLGRKDTEDEAQLAAYTWMRAVSEFAQQIKDGI